MRWMSKPSEYIVLVLLFVQTDDRLNHAPCFLIGSRQVREVAIVSARALMVDSPLLSFRSLIKDGTSPHRARMSSRSLSASHRADL